MRLVRLLLGHLETGIFDESEIVLPVSFRQGDTT